MPVIGIVTAGFAGATSIGTNCSHLSGPTELTGNVVCSQLNLASLPNFSVVNDIAITITGSINGSLSLFNLDNFPRTGMAGTDSAFNLNSSLAGFNFPLNGFGDLIDAIFSTGVTTVPPATTRRFPGLLSGSIFDQHLRRQLGR